jgi:translation initiation factor 3 subunit B
VDVFSLCCPSWLTQLFVRHPDLKAQYEVKLEEGLDTFVVIDGLPVVPEESRQKLIKFLLRKLNTVGHTSEDAVFMPLNDKNMSEGYVEVEKTELQLG